ncbi:MBL fold metallo-hydrolase [Brevibacillus formosus]|uniref:MBL fold metallo-hydrolase n=1 Tax=Brevibacillus TaxID=55080 RepID=UPI000D0F789B|nr:MULTISPECIES: MBL fold metallo-hydrolase [Brevibacillus]MBG9942717.1 hydrolase glyoxylase [Brevibacillus formosus]MED1945085.1 MBL fold metallo-hydrolase [Brevibacillus formosus]MED1996228.1 MBL fold metallo-hydrolase [Brevibacillus formosus]MED2081197.1 MBL fold metallo-hydrolase [Brevibacillus formosus]PSK14355.1 hydrolase glyoxylase [Brevibacillus sp. NRRL NRS-603]
MDRLELIEVAGSSYVVSGKYGIGVYLDRSSKTAVCIDSGPNTTVIEKVCTRISDRGYQILAVVHTHGHAVNHGGNPYLKKRFPNLRIYATHLASYIIENPLLEPFVFDAGGGPDTKPDENKENTRALVTDFLPSTDSIFHVHTIPFKIVSLPGHSPGMVGIITPDHVLYCGDALFGAKTLNKQDLLFFNDLKAARRSFKKLSMMKLNAYVLYHGGPYKTVTGLINKHLTLMKDTSAFLEAWIHEQPSTLEQLVQKVMKKYEFEDDLHRYGLTASIIRSYLKELQQENRIVAKVDNGFLLFSKPAAAT